MEDFRNYLIKKKLIDKSIKRIIDITQKYLNWLDGKNLRIEDSRYSDLVNYIGYLQARPARAKYVESCSNLKNDNARSRYQPDLGVVSLKTVTINDYIRCISHYYSFRNLGNVTVGVRLLGEIKRKYPLFNEDKLDEIYNGFCASDSIKKIILGLIIYQGLDRNEVFRLKIDDLDLVDHLQKYFLYKKNTTILISFFSRPISHIYKS